MRSPYPARSHDTTNTHSVGLAGETNVQGEEQKKLDVLSNDIMINSLRASGRTAVLVSEELEQAVLIDDRHKGKYCVVFDPLDGSSNIDAGVNIGTIFGIYKIVSPCPPFTVCRPLMPVRTETGLEGHDFGCPAPRQRDGRGWLHDVRRSPVHWCPSADGVSGYRYGSSANLVLSTGNGVNGYTLDAALGEFILTHPEVRH